MLPADAEMYSGIVGPLIDGLGRWETHDQRARTIEYHDSLAAAMRADPVQAFLRVLAPDGTTVGPLIQYLHSSWWTSDPQAVAAGHGYRPRLGQPETIEPGRLAYMWFPMEEPEWIQRDFARLIKVAWKALTDATKPHIARADGKPMPFLRVGPAVEEWLRADPGRVVRYYSVGVQLREPT